MDSGIPVIVSAGRLDPEKDHATLLRAFARLRQQRPARLIILGTGKVQSAIEAQAADLGISADILLPGFVGNPFSLIRCAKVLAISSITEGLPNVLIEALACGTSVVTTRCVHPVDQRLIDHWIHATVPIGDDELLALALADAIDHPDDPAALADHVKGFTTELAVAGYEALLFDPADRRSPAELPPNKAVADPEYA